LHKKNIKVMLYQDPSIGHIQILYQIGNARSNIRII
ncbi:unnamed protein product, partial [marine sediment metagenome]